MDSVTHSLVGLMLARSAFGKCPRGTPLMMIAAANLPDIDILATFGGGLTYLAYHRSYTHALMFAPLLALIPPLVILPFFKQRISLLTYGLSLVAILSHLLLDWTNVYGIRMLLPFSERWLRLDTTSVVDPWILVVLILAVAAPALARLVSSEIGSRAGHGPKRSWAIFALVAILAYEGVRWTAHARAVAVLGSHLYSGAPAKSITALPSSFRPWYWRGVIEGEGFVAFLPLDLTEGYDPTEGRIEYPAEKSRAIDVARATQSFQVFEKFCQLPFWRISAIPNEVRVELIDLRFGTPDAPGFEAVAEVSPGADVRSSRVVFGIPVPGR